jgi:hypothetical protein
MVRKWRKGNLCTVSKNLNWYSHYENSIEVSQKLKAEIP